jgi:hypothetical protein
MSVLDWQFGRNFSVNLFHDCTQYLFRYRDNWLSVMYNYRWAWLDKKESHRPLSRRKVREILTRVLKSKELTDEKRRQLFPPEVLRYFAVQYGVGTIC